MNSFPERVLEGKEGRVKELSKVEKTWRAAPQVKVFMAKLDDLSSISGLHVVLERPHKLFLYPPCVHCALNIVKKKKKGSLIHSVDQDSQHLPWGSGSPIPLS